MGLAVEVGGVDGDVEGVSIDVREVSRECAGVSVDLRDIERERAGVALVSGHIEREAARVVVDVSTDQRCAGGSGDKTSGVDVDGRGVARKTAGLDVDVSIHQRCDCGVRVDVLTHQLYATGLAVNTRRVPWHDAPMAEDDLQAAVVATLDADGGELVARQEIDPQALVQALRVLQERIPGAVQLTLREKQSLARAANLDPKVVESGLSLGASWGTMKEVLGWSAEEVRAELETARQWDEVESVLGAIVETVRATNLKRKNRIGVVILQVYGLVGAKLRDRAADGFAHLRPFYEEMKRAILGTRKKGPAQRG